MAFEVVPFDEDEILVVRDPDGKGSVVVKRICENIGVGYESQLQKLKGCPWSGIQLIVIPDARGHNQETCVVPIDSLPMWLATIAPGRVRTAIRPKLLRYQTEAKDVLARHFLGDRASVTAPRSEDMPTVVNPDDPRVIVGLRLAEQTRQLVQLLDNQVELEKRIKENERLTQEVAHKTDLAKVELGEVKRQVEAVREEIVADTHWVTAMGFTKLHGIDRTVHELARDGKMLTALCHAEGIAPKPVRSEVFGKVNRYPEPILRRFYGVEDSLNGCQTHT